MSIYNKLKAAFGFSPSTVQVNTIFVDGISYTIDRKCGDIQLIEQLKGQNKLNNSIDTNKYVITCTTNIGYVAERKLGEGGYNDVYSIKNVNDKVLRVTNKNAILDLEITGLFLQTYIGNNLCSENSRICKVHEFGYLNAPSRERRVYAILEKLKKPDIFDEINKVLDDVKRDKQPYINFKTIFRQLLEGLKCMNDNGYVHLDIKPENVGIDEADNVKLVDFGMANYIPGNNLRPGSIFGTPFYMDPHFRKSGFISKNSDVYAVGVIMITVYFKYNLTRSEDLAEVSSVKNKPWNDSSPFYRNGFFEDANDAQNPDLLAELVRKMVKENPSDRCTAAWALEDQWFTGSPRPEPESEPLPLPVLAASPPKTTSDTAPMKRLQSKIGEFIDGTINWIVKSSENSRMQEGLNSDERGLDTWGGNKQKLKYKKSIRKRSKKNIRKRSNKTVRKSRK